MSEYSPVRFSAQVGLCLEGLRIRQMRVWEEIEERVKIKQKRVEHRPIDKLKDAFIGIMAGGRGLVEINTLVRPDALLQVAFGRQGCADQSQVSRTLDACDEKNLEEMREALKAILHQHSQIARHKVKQQGRRLLDIDMTGAPAGRQGEGVTKGYFAKAKGRRGRQIGRVLASDYDEVVVEHLYEGKRQLNEKLRELVSEMEEVLDLRPSDRLETILRIDAGGGSEGEINFLLGQGYSLITKMCAWQRVESLCQGVNEWLPDPRRPGRELALVPEPFPFVEATLQVAVRVWQPKTASWKHFVLVAHLPAHELCRLADVPCSTPLAERDLVFALAYAYDQRGGALETAFRNSKQGLGITHRNKRSFVAQQMLLLLGQLAYNLLTWLQQALVAFRPTWQHWGPLRLIRDVLHIPGTVQLLPENHLLITLQKSHPYAADVFRLFSHLLLPHSHLSLNLYKI